MGMGGNENSIFSIPFPVRGRELAARVSGAISASPGTSADSDTLDCHSPPAKKRRVFDFNDLCDPEDDQQQSRNELAVSTWMGMRVEGNGKGMEIKLG